jgi:hypothetical protein
MDMFLLGIGVGLICIMLVYGITFYIIETNVNNGVDSFCSPNVYISSGIYSCNGKAFACNFEGFFSEKTNCQYISIPINIIGQKEESK